jgi:hypothetical protein
MNYYPVSMNYPLIHNYETFDSEKIDNTLLGENKVGLSYQKEMPVGDSHSQNMFLKNNFSDLYGTNRDISDDIQFINNNSQNLLLCLESIDLKKKIVWPFPYFHMDFNQGMRHVFETIHKTPIISEFDINSYSPSGYVVSYYPKKIPSTIKKYFEQSPLSNAEDQAYKIVNFSHGIKFLGGRYKINVADINRNTFFSLSLPYPIKGLGIPDSTTIEKVEDIHYRVLTLTLSKPINIFEFDQIIIIKKPLATPEAATPTAATPTAATPTAATPAAATPAAATPAAATPATPTAATPAAATPAAATPAAATPAAATPAAATPATATPAAATPAAATPAAATPAAATPAAATTSTQSNFKSSLEVILTQPSLSSIPKSETIFEKQLINGIDNKLIYGGGGVIVLLVLLNLVRR